MALTKEVFHVELMPNQCTQQCGHCPNAKKAGEPVVFSPQTLSTFDRLMSFVSERAGAISRLVVSGLTPGTMNELPRLTLPVTPDALSVHCGTLPHGDNANQAVINRIDEVAMQMNRLFDDIATPHPHQALSISTTPRFDEHGLIADVDSVALAGIQFLHAACGKQGALARFKPELLDLSLDCNDLSPEAYDFVLVPHGVISGAALQSAFIGKICRVIASRYPRKSVREDITCTAVSNDARFTIISASHEFDDGFQFTTAMRGIEKPPQLPNYPTPLPKRHAARLGVMFDARGVWIEHHTHHVGDASVRFTHGEFCDLLGAAQSSGAWLQDTVYDAIEARRARVLAAV